MKVVVVGATGTIGAAVAKLFKQQGHEVVALSRRSSPPVDMRSLEEIEAFYREAGEIDAIVTVAGEAAFSPLDQLTEEGIELSLASKLMGQINMVRKGLRNLRPGGVAVLTGGILAYTPAPQTAMITMINAGLEGFVRAAALEMTEERRILIVHPPWVRETAEALGMDAAPWPPATKVAEAYLQAVQGAANGTPVFVEGYSPGKT
jgi:NAD(P)-dependent dehydrogenase (short-subunit alcohol dehydrogenase family)